MPAASDSFGSRTVKRWVCWFRIVTMTGQLDQGQALFSATLADWMNRITFHPAQPGQEAIYTELRTKFAELMKHVFTLLPDSQERSISLGRLREGLMFAVAGVAVHDVGVSPVGTSAGEDG
jgi:hypothetical protein